MTPSDDHLQPRFPFISGALTLALSIGCIAAAVVALLSAVGRPEQSTPCLIAAAVCGVAAVLALVPVALLAKRSGARGAAMGFVAGMLVRMALCGGGLLLLQGSGAGGGVSLSLWIGAWYMIALAVEVMLIGRYVGRLPRPGIAA